MYMYIHVHVLYARNVSTGHVPKRLHDRHFGCDTSSKGINETGLIVAVSELRTRRTKTLLMESIPNQYDLSMSGK